MENRTITVSFEAPRDIQIGDVFYKVVYEENLSLREKCRMCNDEKTITVNGITEKCPHCGKNEEYLTIHNAVVRRYRVYGISDEVSSEEWKPSDNHRIKIKLYRKVGRGYSYWNSNHSLSEEYVSFLNYLNPKGEALEKNRDFWFDDYKAAVAAADYLRALELKKLDDFNALHGTRHVAEFKAVNDEKSK